MTILPLSFAQPRSGTIALCLPDARLQRMEATGDLSRLRAILPYYARSFERVYLLTGDSGDFGPLLQVDRVEHLRMPLPAMHVGVVPVAGLPLLHLRALRNVDVVRSFTPAGAVLGWTARLLGKARFVAGYPGAGPMPELSGREVQGWSGWLGIRARRRADLLVLGSHGQSMAVRDEMGECAARVVRAPVDTGLFRPLEVTDPERERVLLWAGRFENRHNPVLFLELIQRLDEREEKFRGVMLGKGPLKRELESRVKEAGLPVEILADLPFEALPGLLARSWATILTSDSAVPWYLLYAMSSALPTVAVRGPATGSLVRQNQTGLIVESPDADLILSAIARLAREPRLRAITGGLAREYIDATYSIDAVMRSELDAVGGREEPGPVTIDVDEQAAA